MIPQPLSPLEQKRRALNERHAQLKKDTSQFYRWPHYFFRLLVGEARLAGDLLRGRLSKAERAALQWECGWFFERLGPGLVKDRLRPVLNSHPLLQLPFLLSLTGALGVSFGQIRAFWREALDVEKDLRDRWNRDGGELGKAGMLDFSAGRLMYVLVRALRPSRIIETGVANGSSTTFILSAVKANGQGELHSLDMPVTADGKTFIPPGKQPGWLVPDGHCSPWHLQRGDTWALLPALLERLKPIDLFFHDSDHSYDTMKFEYTQAWEALAPGGWLTSDDVGFNGAFPELSLTRSRRHWVWIDRLGIMQKPIL